MFLSLSQSIILLSIIALLLSFDVYFCLNTNNISNKYFKLNIWILSLNKKTAKDENEFRKQTGYGSIRFLITIILLITVMFFVNCWGLNYKMLYLVIALQVLVIFYNQKKINEMVE